MYIDAIFVLSGYIFNTHLYCLVGCLSMIGHMLIWVFICMCFVFLCLHLFNAIEHVSRGKVH